MLVGEAPGADEERLGRPFVGLAGQLFDGALAAVGLPRAESFITNVCKYRPPNNKIAEWLTRNRAKAKRNSLSHECKGMFYNDAVAEGFGELREEVSRVAPKVIVAMGNAALWAFTGEWGVESWRGSELVYNGIRLIPVVHPAAILRQYTARPWLILDLQRRVMAKMGAESPEPPYKFVVGRDPSVLNASLDFLITFLSKQPRDLTIDVETHRGRIACVGIGWSALDAVCVPFMDADEGRVWDVDTERRLATGLRQVIEHPNARIIGQNFNYDSQYFSVDPLFGWIPPCHYDTMAAQHLLLPGTPKDLVHLSSVYCNWHRYWKDDLKGTTEERKQRVWIASLDMERFWRYNCRDCVVTWEVKQSQQRNLLAAGFVK